MMNINVTFFFSGPTNSELAVLQQMQENFELEQSAMQHEYQSQVDKLQQEWLTMQSEQEQQRQHVSSLLQQQEAKIQQAAHPEIGELNLGLKKASFKLLF